MLISDKMKPKRLVYLAYPIDNAQLSNQTISEIERAKAALMEGDLPACVTYDPGDAFKVRKGADVGPEIAAVNETALEQADAVLAFMPKGVPSTGVPMEIMSAAMSGKPVAILSDAYSWSLQLDRPNVMLYAEPDWRAAVEWLQGAQTSELGETKEPMPVVGELPTRAYADDAGLDLYVAEDTELKWGQFTDVPLSSKVALPAWSWGFLVGRSSTFRKRGIEVMPGIIDTGYRGKLFAACIWRPDKLRDEDVIMNPGSYALKSGERIAQMIVIPNGTRDVEPYSVRELPAHDRGEKGFGSSGE